MWKLITGIVVLAVTSSSAFAQLPQEPPGVPTR
jgi:hypothetical protein